MDVDRLYDRVFDSCTTTNQVNQLQILLENRMTPGEAESLAGHIRRVHTPSSTSRRLHRLRAEVHGRFARPHAIGTPRTLTRYEREQLSVEWADRLVGHLASTGAAQVSAVTRQWSRGGATLYRSAGPRSGVLVVGFTGNARRLMMPAFLFLHYVGNVGADLLLLEVPKGTRFTEGVPGFSRDLPSTIEWLRELLPTLGATRVVAVGTSGGGLPAILAGLALPLDAVLAAGASTAKASTYALAGESPGLAEVVHSYEASCRPPTTYLMYGVDSALDTQAVEMLLPVVPNAVSVPVQDSAHGCLHDLVQRGGLEEALASTIFAHRQHHGVQPDQIRSALVEILLDSGIHYLRDHALEESFVEGTVDVPLIDLRMDSLAAMELCIALELEFDSSIVPSTLLDAQSLVGLVDRLQKERGQ